VEHKSAGADLGKAHAQGMDYIRGLKDTGRDREIPRWLIVSDFNRIALHDLEPEQDPDAPLLQRLTKKPVIRPPSPFILSPGERKWLLAGSGFADHRLANPVAQFTKWTANDSPSPRGRGPGRGRT
jgi:hypothetical protein